LVSGDVWNCHLDGLVPQRAGSATLDVEARCESDRGREVAYRFRFQVRVAGRGKALIDDQRVLKVVIQGDYVAGDRHTGVDQRGQKVQGPQTNVAGDVSGPLASGQFESATSVGGGEATDRRGENAKE
jgi:hypothetical protein